MDEPNQSTFVGKMRAEQPSTEDALTKGAWTGSGPEQVVEFSASLAEGREDADGDEDMGSGSTM